MPKMKRCEETGEIVVNGRLGLVTAWLRWLQPWMITAVVLPGIFWSFQHYYEHETLEEFTAAGSRVYSSSGEDVSTDQLKDAIMLEVAEYVAENVPPADVETRLSALEAGVAQNHALLLQLLQRRD